MIKMRTDFPGGNGQLLAANANGELVDVVFRAETKWREPQANWFYFTLDGLTGKTIRLHLANAEQCLDDFGVQDWTLNHPVYRAEGKEWQRIQKTQCIMNDMRCYDVFFDAPILGETMQFAFCYPYQVSDLTATLDECPRLPHTVIGYSALGRPIIRVSTNVGDESKEKKGVYIIARQHAGEVGGSWMLDGMLRFLNSDEGMEMTKNQMWWIVPTMDVDGIEEGCYGKDQVWEDFNHSWAAPFPKHVEIHAVEHDMDHWRDYCTPALFVDVHSPGNDVRGHIFNIHMEMGKTHLDMVDTITDAYNDCLAECHYENSVNHYKFNKVNTSASKGILSWDYATNHYNIPSIVSELSYQGPNGGGTYSLEDYRIMGKCFAMAIAQSIK